MDAMGVYVRDNDAASAASLPVLLALSLGFFMLEEEGGASSVSQQQSLMAVKGSIFGLEVMQKLGSQLPPAKKKDRESRDTKTQDKNFMRLLVFDDECIHKSFVHYFIGR